MLTYTSAYAYVWLDGWVGGWVHRLAPAKGCMNLCCREYGKCVRVVVTACRGACVLSPAVPSKASARSSASASASAIAGSLLLQLLELQRVHQSLAVQRAALVHRLLLLLLPLQLTPMILLRRLRQGLPMAVPLTASRRVLMCSAAGGHRPAPEQQRGDAQ